MKWLTSYKLAATMLVLAAVVAAVSLYKSTAEERVAPESEDAIWLSKVKQRSEKQADESSLAIVSFMDFTCEHCKSLYGKLDSISGRYGDKVYFVSRHLPIVSDSLSSRFAAASECARAQNRFASMEEEIYRTQSEIAGVKLVDLAENAGVDNLSEFSKCVETRKFSDTVRRDSALAAEMNINSVPAFVVGNSLVRGDVSLERLDSLVASKISDN
jgi:protein-disulfide isomerase